MKHKLIMENFRKFATEETDSVMNEGFFGNMGDKMGFETGTTKGRVARIGMLVKLWQEAVENADIMDAEDFDGLMANTGEHLKAANFEPEKIAQILLAMGSGDGSAASDAYLAAAQDVQMRGGAGSDLIELFRNGLEDIVYAVGEEEARRSAQTHAENMAGLKSDVEAQAAADSTDNSKRIQRVSDDDDDVPHGRATSAVASSNLAYGEGKINQAQLIKIIKEELEATLDEAGYFDPNREPGEGYPFGTPLPGLRGTIKDFVPKSMAHAVGNKSKGLAGNPKYIAAWKAVGKELRTHQDIETFIRAVKMPNAEPDAPLTPDAKDVFKKLLKSMDNNKLKAVHSLKDVVSLMGSEGKRRGHAIGSERDPGYVRE